jgi:hypothetical protein
MEIRHPKGLVAALGIVLAVAGAILMALASTNGLTEAQRLAMMVVGAIVGGAGVLGVTWTSGVTVTPTQLDRWWGLLLPFAASSRPATGFQAVSVTRGGAWEGWPILLRAAGGQSYELTRARTRSEAWKEAREAAQVLQLPLRDETREPRVDFALADLERPRTLIGARPEIVAIAGPVGQLTTTRAGGAVEWRLPAASLGPALLQLAFVVGAGFLGGVVLAHRFYAWWPVPIATTLMALAVGLVQLSGRWFVPSVLSAAGDTLTASRSVLGQDWTSHIVRAADIDDIAVLHVGPDLLGAGLHGGFELIVWHRGGALSFGAGAGREELEAVRRDLVAWVGGAEALPKRATG